VEVYAGVDPISGHELYLGELVKAKRTRRETELLTDKALTKLLNE
jgi:hypothetical protein